MQIRANKFFPPQVDTPQFLFRERIVDELLRRGGARKPTILLEAQAGQGKTTLVKQFLDRIDCPSVWYQVGPEDADPAFFFVAFQACIANLLPPSPPAAGERELPMGEFGLFDLPKHIDPVLNDLKASLKKDLYIVFDDLHTLLPHETSLLILNYLVENAPPKLHCILSSREPLPLDAWKPFPAHRDLIWIGNKDLALTASEITAFFHQVFTLSLAQDDIRLLAAKTDGWVMGLVMLGLQMTQRRRGAVPIGLSGAGHSDILNYFRQQIFDPLEPRLRGPMLVLSLLEDIPTALARILTREPEIGADLARLVARNIFIRNLDPENTLYGLHHLFRQFLREKAHAELRPKTIRQTFRQAGQFFAQAGNTALALRYLLQAGDSEAAESILQQSGAAMLSANQSATLAAILGDIPEADLARLGWCAFYLALAHMDIAPARALPLLHQALEAFCSRQDAHGELLCLAHIISIHITTTGHYREGEALLVKAERIFADVATDLDATTTVLLARSLAMGRCIFLADTATATRYANLALTLAGNAQQTNFKAGLLMVMGYIQIFAGHLSQARLWLEQAAAAARSPDVGTFNCLAIRMMLFNYLFHDGDFENYADQKGQLFAAMGHTLVFQSIAGPFSYIWDMDIAINRGQFDTVQALASQALALAPPLSPHVQSLVMELQAVALALTDNPGLALETAAQATSLREQAGGLYFVSLNRILAGLTQGLCGNHDQALALVTEGIDLARRMPTDYLEACGLFHRSAIHLARGDEARAGKDLETCLGLMRRNSYLHIWAWTPRAIEKVLGFAVARRIEPDYARLLAAKRIAVSLLDDGTALPRLEFRTLGGFSIVFRGVPILEAESLTPTQRELFCLLLASPGLKLAQESAQLHFWPDSSPSAAKTAFDTMLSRLRKNLTESLPGNTAKHYLRREKGILWLEHCHVDALEFQAAVHAGLKHSRLQEYWQAGNAFTRAEALWQGEFAPRISGEDEVRAFRHSLIQSLVKMTLAWCEQLAGSNRLQSALDVVEKALRAAPLSDSLWALLYRLQGRRSAILARQVLKRFAKQLQAEDYPEQEIAELLSTIAASPNALA